MIFREFYIKGSFLNLLDKIKMFSRYVECLESREYKKMAVELKNELETGFDNLAFKIRKAGNNFETLLENLNESFKKAVFTMQYIYTNQEFKLSKRRLVKKTEVEKDIDTFEKFEHPTKIHPRTKSLIYTLCSLTSTIKQNAEKALENQNTRDELINFYDITKLNDIIEKASHLINIQSAMPELDISEKHINNLIKTLKKGVQRSEDILEAQKLALAPDVETIHDLDLKSYRHRSIYTNIPCGSYDRKNIYHPPRNAVNSDSMTEDTKKNCNKLLSVCSYLHQETDRLVRERYQNVPELLEVILNKEKFVQNLRKYAQEEALKKQKHIKNLVLHMLYTMPDPPAKRWRARKVKIKAFQTITLIKEDGRKVPAEIEIKTPYNVKLLTLITSRLEADEKHKKLIPKADPLGIKHKASYSNPLKHRTWQSCAAALTPYTASTCQISCLIDLQALSKTITRGKAATFTQRTRLKRKNQKYTSELPSSHNIKLACKSETTPEAAAKANRAAVKALLRKIENSTNTTTSRLYNPWDILENSSIPEFDIERGSKTMRETIENVRRIKSQNPRKPDTEEDRVMRAYRNFMNKATLPENFKFMDNSLITGIDLFFFGNDTKLKLTKKPGFS